MQTLLEILDKTSRFFEQKGISNARLNAELIFAYILGCERMELYMHFDRPLPETVLERMRPLVRRRANREPLQYIIAEVGFMDLELTADSRALIPRPETEELVERVIERVDPDPTSILDLGTGSGCIALALAHRFPEARVLGVDVDAEALSLARENARRTGLATRVEFRPSDWFSEVEERFQLIVANPPYLTEREWMDAEPEVREFEPRSALVAGDDGLTALSAILADAYARLDSKGLLALETGIAHHDMLETSAAAFAYSRTASFRDLQGRTRFFFAWRD